MDLQLHGKTALVTGSTAGIGLAIAQSLAREGAKVIVNGRTPARVDAAVDEVGHGARGIVADLSTPAGRGRLLAEVPQVDILVNNLGFFEAHALDDVRDDDWQRFFDFNVVSGAVLSQHYLRGMRRNNWGRVLFVASETGVNIPPDMIPYGVSKAAQIALSRGLAETTAGTGVTVNAILPGPTRSEGVEKFLASLPMSSADDSREEVAAKFLLELRPTSLLRRFASADEVATMATYLVSPLASATNGAALRVEGGLLRNAL